jgi:hypothetical protein
MRIFLCVLLLTGFVARDQAPVRHVPDPGVVTTRQTVTPAGTQSVFPGRVYAVTFCGSGEVAVAVSGDGNEEISILSTVENRLLSQARRPNRVLGIQGAVCNAQSKELLVADAVFHGSPPTARSASVSIFRVSDLHSEEITDQHAPQISALELPAGAKPPVAINSGAVGGIGASEGRPVRAR